MEQIVVLVDEQDQTIGQCEKLEAHRKGLLHRAFSVFLFDRSRGAYLMQRRAAGKYHSGGKWSNSCCSHPLVGESWEQAISRCLKAELGLELQIRVGENIFHAGQFHYYAPFETNSEHEMDHVFFLPVESLADDAIHTEPEETDAVRWVSPGEIRNWIEKRPQELSAWFAPAFQIAQQVADNDDPMLSSGGKRSDFSPAELDSLPAPEILLQTMEREYDRENARIDQLDNKAMSLLTLIIALITVYVPIFPFGELGAFFAVKYLWTFSTWAMFLFLGLGLAASCMAVRCVSELISAYSIRDYNVINRIRITRDAFVMSKYSASAKLLLVKEYYEIIQHNADLNENKAEILRGQFSRIRIIFMMLAVFCNWRPDLCRRVNRRFMMGSIDDIIQQGVDLDALERETSEEEKYVMLLKSRLAELDDGTKSEENERKIKLSFQRKRRKKKLTEGKTTISGPGIAARRIRTRRR